jgi:hypothetical protein
MPTYAWQETATGFTGEKGPPDESSENPLSWLKAGIWETEELQKTDSGVGEEPKT